MKLYVPGDISDNEVCFYDDEGNNKMSNKQDLENLSNLRENIFKLVDEYNDNAKKLEFQERLALMSSDNEDWYDSGYVSVYDKTGWFPSSVGC